MGFGANDAAATAREATLSPTGWRLAAFNSIRRHFVDGAALLEKRGAAPIWLNFSKSDCRNYPYNDPSLAATLRKP
jgi:hypothetical protein